MLVTMNEPALLRTFKQQFQFPFICLSDPKQDAYSAFHCPRGRLRDIIGPVMWWRAIMSLFRHGLGRPRGDVTQLPGSFVIDRDGIIRFAHRSRHSADWASPQQLVDVLNSLAMKS